MRLLLKSQRRDLADAFELFLNLFFSHIKRDVVDEDVVVEGALHVLSDRGETILVEHVLLLVDKAAHIHLAATDIHFVKFVNGTLCVFLFDVAHKCGLSALSNGAGVKGADFGENSFKFLLSGVGAESLNVEVSEVLGSVLGSSLISGLVDVNFEGVAFPDLLVESFNCFLGIFSHVVLNVGEATGESVVEAI